LVSNDGVIALQEVNGQTLYFETDFIHGKLGVLGFLSKSTALKKTVEGVVATTLAIQEAANLDQIEDNKIARTVLSRVNESDIQTCLKNISKESFKN
jgi:hypothetical protein